MGAQCSLSLFFHVEVRHFVVGAPIKFPTDALLVHPAPLLEEERGAQGIHWSRLYRAQSGFIGRLIGLIPLLRSPNE